MSMSNKQVVAIFVIGIALLFAAFWIGLFIVKPDLPASANSNATVAANQNAKGSTVKAAPNTPTSGSAATAGVSGFTTAPPAASDDTRYVVLIGTFGTLEQAKQLVTEMRRDY